MNTPKYSTVDIKVRNYHLDFFQHVNNTRYLEFLEEARWAYFEDFEELWYRHFNKSVAFVVVNINIDYRYPATIGQTLEVRTGLTKIGKSSSVFSQDVYLKGTETVVAKAQVTLVLMDGKSKQSIPMPDAIREAMENPVEA